jgi:hypothetical protein
MDNRPPYLRRREASAYLHDRYSICRAPSTLAKLAVVGGGPRFRHVGRVPIYPVGELDAFAASITSALKTSTSDPGSPNEPTATDAASGDPGRNRTPGTDRPDIGWRGESAVDKRRRQSP